MKLIITPVQVAELAFRAPDFITPEAVPEATILAVQQKHILPVFGAGLCSQFAAEAGTASVCGTFVKDYLAMPVALYVKASMLPSLAVQAGAGGIVESHGANITPAGDKKIRAAIRRLRADARALMLRAAEYVENAPENDFRNYDPRKNILRRCSIEGGVVISK